ncbi:Heat shock factor protein 2 [Dispira parvispora]|uniref:Heat shock factor protein 2 n=1 Tax=Dispira parvispora TaxID=1520584 RepID=A0A9W8AUG0_9FUNG|nr:Heat shock factor protein 2 [Dispira parvispora]
MAGIPPFIEKLYRIFHSYMFTGIIGWDVHGKCIIIYYPVRFEKEVMPRYFKTNDFRSFTRQLHIYGFDRISDDRKRAKSDGLAPKIFCNPDFVRGGKDLLVNIKRVAKKGDQAKSNTVSHHLPRCSSTDYVFSQQYNTGLYHFSPSPGVPAELYHVPRTAIAFPTYSPPDTTTSVQHDTATRFVASQAPASIGYSHPQVPETPMGMVPYYQNPIAPITEFNPDPNTHWDREMLVSNMPQWPNMIPVDDTSTSSNETQPISTENGSLSSAEAPSLPSLSASTSSVESQDEYLQEQNYDYLVNPTSYSTFNNSPTMYKIKSNEPITQGFSHFQNPEQRTPLAHLQHALPLPFPSLLNA